MMDWYCGLEAEDLAVPGDQELLDVFTSLTSWSNWGIYGPESSGWIDNSDTCKKTTNQPLDEELHQKLLFGKVNGDSFLQESEHSNSSSISSGWSENASCQRNPSVHSHPDFLFNDLTESNHLDDIFLSLLLKDNVAAREHIDDPFAISFESQFNCLESSDVRPFLSGDGNAGQVPSLSSHSINNMGPHERPSAKGLETPSMIN